MNWSLHLCDTLAMTGYKIDWKSLCWKISQYFVQNNAGSGLSCWNLPDVTMRFLLVVVVELFSWWRWFYCHFQGTNLLNSRLLKFSFKMSCSIVLRVLFWDSKWQSGKERRDTSMEIFRHTWKSVEIGFQSTLSAFKNPTQIAVAISGGCLLFCY